MKFEVVKNQLSRNLRDALRQAGYHSLENPRTGLASFVRRLSRTQYYPRFHLYVDEFDTFYRFNLHLDQKKPSYKGQKAHSGEYDDNQVKEEAARIQLII
jgi:hypothetical protein